MYLRITMFNSTNPAAIHDPTVEPHFEKVGLYVFLQHHDRVDLNWHPENDTVSSETCLAFRAREFEWQTNRPNYEHQCDVIGKWTGETYNQGKTLLIDCIECKFSQAVAYNIRDYRESSLNSSALIGRKFDSDENRWRTPVPRIRWYDSENVEINIFYNSKCRSVNLAGSLNEIIRKRMMVASKFSMVKMTSKVWAWLSNGITAIESNSIVWGLSSELFEWRIVTGWNGYHRWSNAFHSGPVSLDVRCYRQ